MSNSYMTPYTVLQRAFSERRLIGVATGVLMHSRGCGAREAREILDKEAVDLGVDVPYLAGHIVEARSG